MMKITAADVRALRARMGMNQEDFGKEIGVTTVQVSRIENEHRSISKTLQKLLARMIEENK